MMKGLILWIVLTGVCCVAAQRSTAIVVQKEDASFAELVKRAVQWQGAVHGRRIELLVGAAWPEYQPEVRRSLQNESSPLHRLLMQDSGSVRQIVLATAPSEIAVFGNAQDSGNVRSFAVCFGHGNPQPRDFNDLLGVPRNGRFCSYWVKDAEGTFLSYTFAAARND